jgi:hypothetical protein
VSDRPNDPHATIDLAEGTRTTGGGSGEGSGIRLAPAEIRTTRLPYDLVEELGSGGMGTVMRAVDTALCREVAVKLLTRTGDERRHARFLAEAQITGQLEHPGIVPVHGFGTAADGRPWFAMKLVRGRTLGEIIAARSTDPGTARAWPVRRLIAVLIQAAQAVAFAHSRGVVHRDVKPANLMLGDFGEVLVMDWGLARMQGSGPDGAVAGGLDAAPEVSVDGTVCGTPCYMPPEQARGERDRIGPASDVFALGATLCEILSGRPPLTGPSASSVVRRAARGEADLPVRDWQGRPLPAALVSICRRALAGEPGQRYPGALAFAADLQAFLDDRGVEAHEAGWWEDAARAVRRHRSAAAVAGVAGLLLAASLAFGYLAERRARGAAEAERVRAEAALVDAERRRADAELGRRRERMLVQGARTQAWLVERGRAAAAMGQAAAGLAADRPERVRAALDAVPGEARDWTWRHLDARLAGARPRRIAAGTGTLVPGGEGVVLVEDDGGIRLVGAHGDSRAAALPRPVRAAAGDAAGRQFAAILEGGGLVLGETAAGRIAALRPEPGERVALGTEGPVVAAGPSLRWRGQGIALPGRATAVAAGAGWAAVAVGAQVLVALPDRPLAALTVAATAARLAASPDGGMLAAAHGRRLRIWDLPDGAIHADVELEQPVTAVAFARDPGVVAVGQADGELVLLDIDLALPLLRLPVGEGAVDGIAWSADGRVLAARPSVGPLVVWTD